MSFVVFLALAGSFLSANSASAWWYGSDTNSYQYVQDGQPLHEYLGKLASITTCATNGWKEPLALAVDKRFVYSYTFVRGPDGRLGNDAYTWGQTQAQNLYDCWNGGSPYWSETYGDTLFADIELSALCGGDGSCGWYLRPAFDQNPMSRWQANVNVLSGFWTKILSLMSGGPTSGGPVPGGVYISRTFLDDQMPYQSWARSSFAWWAYGGCPGYERNNIGTPYNSNGPYYEAEMVDWRNKNNQGLCLGAGQGLSIWQYWYGTIGGQPGGSDFDLTPYENTIDGFGNGYIPTY